MTEDDKQHEQPGSNVTPAAPVLHPPTPLPTKTKSPYFAATSPEVPDEAVNRILRQSADASAITPQAQAAAAVESDHITWRDRLKGLWFAASLFFMAQTSQAELPPPTETTQSEVNPQAKSQTQTGSRTDYKYSAEQSQDVPFRHFSFDQGSSVPYAPQILDQQPEQIVQIVVNVQTAKPSEAEIKDATDYLRGFQHELHKKVLDPGYLADKALEGGEALLGVALFKARKKIRASTKNGLLIWLCDTFDRISQSFKEADDKEAPLPQPKKRPIGFLAGQISCSPEHTVAILKLMPCKESAPGQWELRESS